MFGGVEISESNFNLKGLPKVITNGPGALRGGGEFAHFKINLGDKQTTYQAQWTKPYFLDTPWILGVELEKSDNRAISDAYTIKTYGGHVHTLYLLNNYLKYDIYYRGRHNHAVYHDAKSKPLEEARENPAFSHGFTSAIGASLIYDSTDSPRRATRGMRSRFTYELAGLGGNYHFMKYSYLNSYYFPFNKRGVFKIRADFNFMQTYNNTHRDSIPLAERFFLGGEGTVRGYRPFCIGPKYANNEPTGGLSSMLISEEYRYNILPFPLFDAFVFVDAGYISLSEFTLGRPAASVGFGIHLEVMKNMPLTMGYGWPIHPGQKGLNGEHVDNTQRFFFAFGGNF